MIEILRSDLLTLFTTSDDLSVSCNRVSKAEMRQFGTTRTEGLIKQLKIFKPGGSPFLLQQVCHRKRSDKTTTASRQCCKILIKYSPSRLMLTFVMLTSRFMLTLFRLLNSLILKTHRAICCFWKCNIRRDRLYLFLIILINFRVLTLWFNSLLIDVTRLCLLSKTLPKRGFQVHSVDPFFLILNLRG